MERKLQSIREAKLVIDLTEIVFDYLLAGTELRAISLLRMPCVTQVMTGFAGWLAMYLAKQLTDASLPEIGREFGGKHQTTVMHSIARIHELRTKDAGVNKVIETLLDKLTSKPGNDLGGRVQTKNAALLEDHPITGCALFQH
jgi:hypothetical protein